MPGLLKKLAPRVHALRDKWYLRAFGTQLADPRLWRLQRRSVTNAFAAGLAIMFVPLPVHLPLAALVAVSWRLNIPTIIATVFIVNPFTMVPIYYAAYRIGAALLRVHARPFGFRLSWDWLQHGLGPMWKAFLVGCLASAIICSILGWTVLGLLWRLHVLNRLQRMRRAASSTG
jgi:uncharacterized protein (DUF2062 family)